ncbi:MAG TPA: TIGR01777 family oxidoreductase, partial [Anaerolineae bacterium]
GGGGQMGRALAGDLAKDGYDVVLLSRNPEKVRGLPQNVRAEKWDGRSAQGWGTLANGAAAILNLAGENIGIPPIPWWLPGRKQRIRDSRVQAGQAIVEAVKSATEKPGAVIQASGINYYGLRGDQITTEQESAGSDFAANVCVEWEAATAPVEAMGVRRVILRTAPNLTKKDGILFYLALPFKLFAGGPIGSGKQWFSWIHTVDQVRAVRFLIEGEKARGVYNLTAPEPKTNADFGRLIARTLHRPYWFPVPAFMMRLAFGELGDTLLLGSQRVVPQRLQQAGFKFQFGDAESALKDLL